MPDCFYVILKGSALILLPKDPETIAKEKEKIQQRFKKLQKESQTSKNDTETPSMNLLPQDPTSPISSLTMKSSFETPPLVLKSSNKAIKSLQKITKIMTFIKATSSATLKEKIDKKTFLITPVMRNEVLSSLGIKIETLASPKHFFDGQVLKYRPSGIIGPGQSFGELGLLRKKPRAATILCLENTHFGVLKKVDYEVLYFGIQNRKFENRVIFFKKSLNPALTNDTITKFLYLFDKKKFSFGESVFHQGEEPLYVYLVKKGEVLLEQERYIKDKKKGLMNEKGIIERIFVGTVREGEYFGEDEVMKGRKRRFHAICASSNASIYEISKNVNSLLKSQINLYNNSKPEILPDNI